MMYVEWDDDGYAKYDGPDESERDLFGRRRAGRGYVDINLATP
jgi:hypothetical protein